jgi:hypothetical protein
MTQKGKEENFLNVGLVCDGWNKIKLPYFQNNILVS